jgi:hypothetical protein
MAHSIIRTQPRIVILSGARSTQSKDLLLLSSGTKGVPHPFAQFAKGWEGRI